MIHIQELHPCKCYHNCFLQYGAWATSKKLPCLHKACYTTTGLLAVPTRPQAYRPCQYAPAQHHDRWPARDQGCHGRTSCDTPANCSSRSRHDDAELSLRGKRSNRVVHGPVERTLSLSIDPKRFSSRGVLLLLVAVKPEGLAAHREHCMSKLKYIGSSAKRF